MSILKSIFGNSKKTPVSTLVEIQKNGATVLDVRSPSEFKNGHITSAKNIPVEELSKRIGEVKHMPSPILTVCRSGMRSKMAQKILQKQGIESYNAGAWTAFNQHLK